MTQLTCKLAHELIGALDQIWEDCFKNQPQPPYPYAEWERQRQRVKQRLAQLPEYVERAAAAVRTLSRIGAVSTQQFPSSNECFAPFQAPYHTFQNGDLVEVDATKGIIRLLHRS